MPVDCVRPPAVHIRRAAEEFVRTGRALLQFRAAPAVPSVISGVCNLIEAPNRRDWQLHINRPGGPKKPDDGLIRRDPEYPGDTTDGKYFFHYRRSLEDNLLQRRVIPNASQQDLLMHCGIIHHYCADLLVAFAAEFDQVCPGYRLEEQMADFAACELAPLRTLVYDQGTMVATPHTDYSALTLHLAESRPGLRLGKERTPYTAHCGEALIFPGRKFEKLTKGAFKALDHEVEDSDPQNPNRRWSMVYFGHIPGEIPP